MTEAKPNPPFSNGSNGSQRAVVDLLLKESCKTVIAGQFGEKMKSRLKANQIEYHERTGKVKDVLKTFGSGR